MSRVTCISRVAGISSVAGVSCEASVPRVTGRTRASRVASISRVSCISRVAGIPCVAGVSCVSGRTCASRVAGIPCVTGVTGVSRVSRVSRVSSIPCAPCVAGVSCVARGTCVSRISSISSIACVTCRTSHRARCTCRTRRTRVSRVPCVPRVSGVPCRACGTHRSHGDERRVGVRQRSIPHVDREGARGACRHVDVDGQIGCIGMCGHIQRVVIELNVGCVCIDNRIGPRHSRSDGIRSILHAKVEGGRGCRIGHSCIQIDVPDTTHSGGSRKKTRGDGVRNHVRVCRATRNRDCGLGSRVVRCQQAAPECCTRVRLGRRI